MTRAARSARGGGGSPRPDFALEARLWRAGWSPVAGIDEAGRGALAGPVVAAAVILPAGCDLPLRDSKELGAARRETLAAAVRREAVGWGIGSASASEIDAGNVLRATHLAARRALAALAARTGTWPAALVTDYLRLGVTAVELAPPKADRTSLQVAAASVLAKTGRDAYMVRLHDTWPAYGFDGHKGYGSRRHLAALERHGPCPEHRRSFRPVAQGTLFPR